MSANDVIKNSVYESLKNGMGFSFWNACIILAVACLVGVYLFMIYRFMSKSAFYSKDLNITLAGIVVITAAIMIAMQSNLVVSLGMVGALSIVRFRTAIKNPLELLYLFWAISAGIICGVELFTLSVILCIVMTVVIFSLDKLSNSKANELVVIRVSTEKSIDEITAILKENCRYLKESSITVKNGEQEIIYELRTNKRATLIGALNSEKGVMAVSWLEHHGEMRV